MPASAVSDVFNIKADATLSQFLHSRISEGDFPSAVYVIAGNGSPIFGDALGDAVRKPEPHAATFETIYDLASLTKPLITGLLCAQLVESAELTLDASVSDYLPEFNRSDKSAITIRQLLTHTSGLPAWRPLYLLSGSVEDALAAIANEALEHKPGARVLYSDLGFITLGFLLQRLSGLSLADFAQQKIFWPLQLR